MSSFKMGQQMQLLSKCLEVSIAKRSLMDREAIEETETFSIDRGAIEKLLRLRLKEAAELDR